METGFWVHPHHEWSDPLFNINEKSYKRDRPPLSAVVVNKGGGIPGEKFWGSPGVPKMPSTVKAAEKKWQEIHEKVCKYEWPAPAQRKKAA